jgi:hypothetical protein
MPSPILMDLLAVAVTILSFLALVAFTRGCEKL